MGRERERENQRNSCYQHNLMIFMLTVIAGIGCNWLRIIKLCVNLIYAIKQDGFSFLFKS